MSKWLKRIASAVLVIAALMAGFGIYLVRGSLAELDGELRLTGLSAPAQIERDAGGVASIAAASAADAALALGFVHAQERYFEMDLLRRSAAGELSALFGSAALTHDRSVRQHRMRARMQQALTDLDSEDRALLDAYTSGVRQGLNSLRSRPWPYLLLRQKPQPWLVEDSMLSAAAMAFDLNDANNRREYMFHRLERYFPAELMAVLMADGTEFDAPLMGAPRPPLTLPTGRIADKTAGPASLSVDGEPATAEGSVDGAVKGSNSFAVAGSLTGDHRAILANDMHLGLRAPNIWFRARLTYADSAAEGARVDVSGFSLPGVPGIIVGGNGRVTWGFTNSYGDWLDWVRVDWSNRDKGLYATLDGDEAVQTFSEVIEIAGGGSEILSIRETRWGPILHEHSGEEGGDYALALMWTMHRAGGLDFGLLDMAHAGTAQEALLIGQSLGMPPQNLLVADRDGRIGWTIAGRIPIRLGDCDPQRPLTPLTGCDWGADWLVPSAAPQILDPPDGRLWTANSRVADADALALIGTGGYDLGARQRQIRDALHAREAFSEADLLTIQLDTRSLFLQRWWALMREVAAASDVPELARLLKASQQWEGHASVEAVSYRLARGFRGKVIELVVADLLAEAKAAEGDRWQQPVTSQLESLVWQLVQERPDDWLAVDHPGWEALLADAATQLVIELEQFGPLAQRNWGERNTARICHPLASALPAFAREWVCMPMEPLPGDSHLPRVQSPSFGASQRMVVSPGHESDGIIHAPGGQSGHPLSPFWLSGYRAWADGDASPFLPGEPAHRLHLRP